MSPTCTPDKLFCYNTIYLYLRMVLFKNLTIMKNRLLPMLALAAVCLWTENSANAQVITEFTPTKKGDKQIVFQRKNKPDSKLYDMQRNGNYTTYFPKRTQRPLLANSDEGVDVKFDLKFDEENYMLAMLNIFSTKGEALIRWYSDVEENILNVPADVYDICCVLLPNGSFDSVTPESIWLFKEKVNISKDTVVTFDAAEATNVINIEQYNKSGELYRPVSIDLNTGNILDPGNVSSIYCWSSIFPKDYCYDGLLYTYSGSQDLLWGGFDDYQFNIKTNEVSDRITFAFTRVAIDKENKIFVNKYVQEGCNNSITLKNDPDNYVCYTEEFVPTPAGKETGSYGMPGLDLTILCNDKEQDGIYFYPGKSSSESKNDVSLYIDAVKTSDAEHSYELMAAPMFGDELNMSVMEYPMEDGTVYRDTTYSYSCITGLPVYTDGHNTEYVRTPNYSYRNPQDGGNAVMYPGHEAFSFTNENKGMMYGASAPFCNFEMTSFFSEKLNATMFYYYPLYIGQMGEQRETDLNYTQTTVKFNSNEVYDGDYYGVNEFTRNWATSTPEKGVFDLTFTNSNIEVDGLAGKNVTHIIYDEQKEDAMAPVLQMLQFRSTDDVVTNNFENPKDGILQFAGGDFVYNEIPGTDINWYDCKEQTVAVAYSPYGQDSWTELAVDEIPELYRMPGFGYFYRGSLESVNRESSNGWYDLKVTLTDASGNMQEQTISPAFRIANTTGVSETLQGTMNLRHEGGQIYVTGTEKAGLTIYSVDGTCVMKVADAVSRPVSVSDIKPGMYVVKATSADGNQIVKKITVR